MNHYIRNQKFLKKAINILRHTLLNLHQNQKEHRDLPTHFSLQCFSISKCMVLDGISQNIVAVTALVVGKSNIKQIKKDLSDEWKHKILKRKG